MLVAKYTKISVTTVVYVCNLIIFVMNLLDLQLLGHLLVTARTVAKQEGLAESGYRLGKNLLVYIGANPTIFETFIF